MAPLPESPRLRFRELAVADLDFVAAMLADPEVMRYYPKRYTREEAAAWIQRQRDRYERDGHGLWLVSDRTSGEPRGQVGLVMQDVDGRREAEVGYLVHRPFWRQGLATEAACATRDWAFATLGWPRVISLIRPENQPSRGVAEKLGMAVEKRALHAGIEHLVYAVPRGSRGGGAAPLS
jgi:RimJ/RimL family protein N-acetyltransferase